MRFFPHFVVVGFSNSYLIADDDGKEAALIDPGCFNGDLLTLIESNKLSIRAVFVTHSHDSHIAGITTLLRIYDADVYAFREKIYGVTTKEVREGNIIRCGKLQFSVIETPGHSRDSVVYRVDNYLFTGDTLTAGLTGTTPHAPAHDLLVSSIRKKILSLPDALIIFPGHGPPTRVGIERTHNVILNGKCSGVHSSSAFS
jgi:glyoxylase-like metal-dependent hydrolase (beta-lactamase superfamily II)